MGKYQQALGLWTLKVTDEINFDLKPKKGDNLKLLRMIQDSQKTQDNVKLLDEVKRFVLGMIERDHPQEQEDKDELETLIELNITTVLQNVLVGFKLAKPDDFKPKGDEEKK